MTDVADKWDEAAASPETAIAAMLRLMDEILVDMRAMRQAIEDLNLDVCTELRRQR